MLARTTPPNLVRCGLMPGLTKHAGRRREHELAPPVELVGPQRELKHVCPMPIGQTIRSGRPDDRAHAADSRRKEPLAHLDALEEALRKGAPVQLVGAPGRLAAALRRLRFATSNESDGLVSTAAHLRVCNGAYQAVKRSTDPRCGARCPSRAMSVYMAAISTSAARLPSERNTRDDLPATTEDCDANSCGSSFAANVERACPTSCALRSSDLPCRADRQLTFRTVREDPRTSTRWQVARGRRESCHAWDDGGASGTRTSSSALRATCRALPDASARSASTAIIAERLHRGEKISRRKAGQAVTPACRYGEVPAGVCGSRCPPISSVRRNCI
jgi:hypothetical protein